jgi:hypothetical protein
MLLPQQLMTRVAGAGRPSGVHRVRRWTSRGAAPAGAATLRPPRAVTTEVRGRLEASPSLVYGAGLLIPLGV